MFPIYRKYKIHDTYYQVESENLMVEIKRLGKTYSINHIESKILPDRNFINDVIKNELEFLDPIKEKDFKEFEEYCTNNLKLNKF